MQNASYMHVKDTFMEWIGPSNQAASLLRLRVRVRTIIAQLSGDGEVGPEGSCQVLDPVVGGLRSQLLYPAEKVGRPQVPVGQASLLSLFANTFILCGGVSLLCSCET